ncbi:hypothetical protein [Vibrio caribbeanicus]|uniref:hypothetical protein n=1 Tax=Vibrio caribbeanicus TaxID=701175 RepID=UPI00228517AC|nr:hypothetical protein [Vibrio caribbeanicus]MCY9844505.1 hypothetical protein [Vibrio caribbeanicus]
MKFGRIFKETRLLWPREIEISDGELRPDNGGCFPQLSKVWDQAEARAESWSDWHQLMVWCIFCGLHKLARESLKRNVDSISIQNIDKRYVQGTFQENLFSNGCSYGRQMRRAYVNDLKP